MKVLGELLFIIKTVNIYVNIENAEDIKEVEIEENRIIIWQSNRLNVIKIKLCKGIYLKQNSISGLHYEPNWLSFRVQLETKTSVVNSVLGELIREIPALSLNTKGEGNLVDKPIQLQCNCGYPLTHVRTFEKVCVLPSVDCDTASENWFCHLHDDQKKAMKFSLIPKENVCFYNELSFCLNSDGISSKLANNTLVCKGCLSEIGVNKGSTAEFWTNDVKWVSEGETIFFKSTYEILLSLFYNLEKDSLGTSSHVLLEMNAQTREFLYLITMDSHLSLLVTENSPLNDLNLTLNCDKFISKKQRLEKQGNYSLRKLKSVKLLYQHKPKEDEESVTWVHDVNVNVLQCGRSFFYSVLRSLESSNECIPGNMRTINNMKIGYIVK